ncbi:TPX2 family protein [Quillaja saponaria]|uniref:TPX2 family protein n=1 Tax=Quillaja saponaria TaxID=32244 RepID=A0AAD7PCP6_QUISA|nr:TPX2 family protein [Quillaja saponaria]
MEKAYSKSALKFVKNTSQSAVQWSSNARGMKSPTRENTKPQEFKLHTQERAIKRAMFNYEVTTKLYLMELQKKQVDKLQKMIEEEEIRLLRKEMVPRAQLMPYFDRPFFPQRSNRPLTIPKEPCFHLKSNKCWSCSSGNELYNFYQSQA